MLGELENRVKEGASFRILKIKNLNFASCKKHILIWMMKTFGAMNGEVKIFFSHGTRHSKGVCILIHPAVRDKVEFSFTDKLGRIVLITIVINSSKLSLCNIYAPNNQTERLEFLQELNNCLIDKAELTTLIVATGTVLSQGTIKLVVSRGKQQIIEILSWLQWIFLTL